MEELVRHDKAVAGAEAIRHIAGEVEPLFDEDFRVRAELPGFLQGFQNKLHIAVRIGVHLVRVVLADRLTGAHFQCFAEFVFRKGMSCGTFGGGFRFPVLKFLLQPCGWITV